MAYVIAPFMDSIYGAIKQDMAYTVTHHHQRELKERLKESDESVQDCEAVLKERSRLKKIPAGPEGDEKRFRGSARAL